MFINYRRTDKDLATAIYGALAETYGTNRIFCALRSIEPGQKYGPEIESALNRAELFFSVIGQNWLTFTGRDGKPALWNSRDWVRLEIAHALSRSVLFVPLLVEEARFPTAEDLPPDISELADLHYLEIPSVPSVNDLEPVVGYVRKKFPYAEVRPASSFARPPVGSLQLITGQADGTPQTLLPPPDGPRVFSDQASEQSGIDVARGIFDPADHEKEQVANNNNGAATFPDRHVNEVERPAQLHGQGSEYTMQGRSGGSESRSRHFAILDRKVLRRRRLLLWLVFGVLFAGLPIIVDLMRQVEGDGLDLALLLSKGEQFVIAAVVAVGAAGEIIAASVPEDEKTSAMLAAGGALLLFVGDLLAYVGVDTASSPAVFILSIILVPLTVVISGYCIGKAAGR
jgi:hypothetical protein